MSNHAPAALPPLPRFDAEQFRRELAGLTESEAGPEERDLYKEAGAKLVYALARLYNREVLEAKTMWDRIGGAIHLACQQVDDGDLDRLVTVALDHVQANPSRVATDEQVPYLIGDTIERDESWRLGFVRYLKTHHYVVLVHGRRYWQMHKERSQ